MGGELVQQHCGELSTILNEPALQKPEWPATAAALPRHAVLENLIARPALE